MLQDKIYVVRGVQVMLDFELAEIYGYTPVPLFNKLEVMRTSSQMTFDFNWQRKSIGTCCHKKLQQVEEGTKEPNHGRFLKAASTCCGASSKDAEIKLMTAISEMTDLDIIAIIVASFDAVVQRYLGNPVLVLR